MRFLVHVKIQPDAPQEEIAEQLPAEQARFAIGGTRGDQ